MWDTISELRCPPERAYLLYKWLYEVDSKVWEQPQIKLS